MRDGVADTALDGTVLLAATTPTSAKAALQLPVTETLCKRGDGTALPDMKPGTLCCHGGDFNNAPIVDARGQGGGGPEGGSANTRVSGPAAAKGEGAPAADIDLKTKADLGAEVKKIKAQGRRATPRPFSLRLVPCATNSGRAAG